MPTLPRPALAARAPLLALACLTALLAPGCAPELGECDSLAAQRVAYDEEGIPAFEGQALMVRSCGYGAFCHAESIPLDNRYGVPLGLDFDVRPAAPDGSVDEAEVRRLRRMHFRTFEERAAIWQQVTLGTMPVRGEVGESVLEGAPSYLRVDPEDGDLLDLPEAGEASGQEILRNWLACGAPVVERTAPRVDGESSAGYIVPARDVEPLAPEWGDIYARLIDRRCDGGNCHGAAREGELDLAGQSNAYRSLVNVRAQGEDCASGGLMLIAPGDPEASLFYLKLAGTDEEVCGRRMPIGGNRVSETSLEAIRAWILAGAPESP